MAVLLYICTSWMHEASKLRYSPESETYHMFVGDDDGERRCIFYHNDGEGLTLTRDGELYDANRNLFWGTPWARKFIQQ